MKKRKNGRLLNGLVKKHPDGFGFLIPDDTNHPDVYIPRENISSALSNDHVSVMVYKKNGSGKKSYYACVHSILKRHKNLAVGLFCIRKKQMFLTKHNLDFNYDIPIQNKKNIPIQEGDTAQVKVYFDDLKQIFKGHVFTNLGVIDDSPKDDLKKIMAKYNIPYCFPKEVLKEACLLPDHVEKKDLTSRLDLQNKAFITIDGETAQDFDDAIYVQKGEDFYKLYVAIADVSHYVSYNSLLDQEAFNRGNSSYFPNFCSPMLPEKLSNGLCSLNPNVPRLAMVQETTFDLQGHKKHSQFYSAVIKSHKRYTYKEVQSIFDSASLDTGNPCLLTLSNAKNLAQILIKIHLQNQALDLDIPETLISLNSKQEPINILKQNNLFAHLMIEQFMLVANQAASAFLEKHKLAVMYRIHPAPKPEKLQNLQTFSKSLGYAKSLQKREHLLEFLKIYKNTKQSNLINKLVLRSLSQACYSAFNKGHYGLNFLSYTHFTSPIRRYCDLLIHRFIKQVLSKNVKSPKISQKELEAQASIISQKEQNSVKAERQIKDIKKARFLEKRIGEVFSGYVSSVSSFGMFISIYPFDIEGLVHVKDLKGFWECEDLQLSLVNKKTSYRIKFGDEVQVRLVDSNVITGNINFTLVQHKEHKIS